MPKFIIQFKKSDISNKIFMNYEDPEIVKSEFQSMFIRNEQSGVEDKQSIRLGS